MTDGEQDRIDRGQMHAPGDVVLLVLCLATISICVWYLVVGFA